MRTRCRPGSSRSWPRPWSVNERGCSAPRACWRAPSASWARVKGRRAMGRGRPPTWRATSWKRPWTWPWSTPSANGSRPSRWRCTAWRPAPMGPARTAAPPSGPSGCTCIHGLVGASAARSAPRGLIWECEEDQMSPLQVEVFGTTLEKSYGWLNDLLTELGWQDQHRAYRAPRGGAPHAPRPPHRRRGRAARGTAAHADPRSCTTRAGTRGT